MVLKIGARKKGILPPKGEYGVYNLLCIVKKLMRNRMHLTQFEKENPTMEKES